MCRDLAVRRRHLGKFGQGRIHVIPRLGTRCEDVQGWLSAMLHRQTTREGSRAQDATLGDGRGFVSELASIWKSGRLGRVPNLPGRRKNMRPRSSHYDGAGERVPQAV